MKTIVTAVGERQISIGFDIGSGHGASHMLSIDEALLLGEQLRADTKVNPTYATYYRPYSAEQVQQFIADDPLTDQSCRETVARAFAALGSDESNISDGIKGTLLELRDVLLGRGAGI